MDRQNLLQGIIIGLLLGSKSLADEWCTTMRADWFTNDICGSMFDRLSQSDRAGMMMTLQRLQVPYDGKGSVSAAILKHFAERHKAQEVNSRNDEFMRAIAKRKPRTDEEWLQVAKEVALKNGEPDAS